MSREKHIAQKQDVVVLAVVCFWTVDRQGKNRMWVLFVVCFYIVGRHGT